MLALLALTTAVGACRESDDTGATPTTLRPIVFTAVGASESVGEGAEDPAAESWPQVLRRRVLPAHATFHNVAVSGATAAEALRKQVPAALATLPDAGHGVAERQRPDFVGHAVRVRENTDPVVHALRRSGATQVLVANTPPVENLPAFNRRLAFIRPLAVARVNEYNAAIARVVKAEGAILVDLHAAGVRARTDGTLPSLIASDGFHPSTAGHKAIASTFLAAVPASLRR